MTIRRLDRVPGQMRVAGGRLNLGMAEQFPDHREALAQGERPRSIRVAKIIHQGSTGVICEPMLSPTRDPDAFTDSFARCA